MRASTFFSGRLAALLAGLAGLPGACSGGGSGGPRPPSDPPPTATALEAGELPPGVVVRILAVGGASGADGSFRTGDRPSVRFRLEQDDGSPWGLSEMGFSSALVSGPTFRYQRVLAERNDVVARAQKNADGSYTYAFDGGLPASYLAPLNDSPDFGVEEGELAGTPLLAGTYTVGLGFAWSYTVEGAPFLDAGDATFDFAFGSPAALEPRRVAGQANCDRCHGELQAHGGLRRSLTLCVLCHTAGAEDQNEALLGGGTPRVSVDSRVLFHKLHNAKHLPSVIGIGVQPSGLPDYSLAPEPYQVATAQGALRDYSSVGFPVFPTRAYPMLEDFGYSSLAPAEQAKDDLARTGVTDCDACHGDPDGTGPLATPEQGTLIQSQPSREACGACHDDVDWTLDYDVNSQVMPPQPTSSGCNLCHEPAGGPISIVDGHRHPLLEPFFNPGLNVDLSAAGESGAANGDGTLDSGEALAVTLAFADDAGASVAKTLVDELRAVVSGPTSNPQVLLDVVIPKSLLVNPAPFTLDLPELVPLEHLGDATAAAGEVFATARAPHVNAANLATRVFVRTATLGAASTTTASALAPANFVDLADASGFARDDFVVIDDGLPGLEEYLQVQYVDGQRLWFSSLATPAYAPGLRQDHAPGAAVNAVQLTAKSAGVHYLLDAQNGTITELAEFGAGNAVVVTYGTPFLWPAAFPGALHDSPDLGEAAGEWAAKPMVDGTYSVSLVARRQVVISQYLESNAYQITSPPAALDFAAGSASVMEPYDRIADPEACNACHHDLSFHAGRYRGFATCIACHAAAGAEDLPPYVAANAPPTPAATVQFRSMLHALHMGARLDDPAAFQVVGAGSAPYPDNFEVSEWSALVFPSMPGAAADCAKCHGALNTAWLEPADRDHPTEPGTPVAEWRTACAACHDARAAIAHIDANTAPSGAESCSICHGPGETEAVDRVHARR